MTALLLLGLAQGLHHAIEPDHLAAVAAIASEERRPWTTARLGALWGAGHAAALAVVAGGLALLGATVPPAFESAAERLVGVLLIALGVRAMVRAFRPAKGPVAIHRHGTDDLHVHVYDHAVGLRPFAVGLVHGLAGSGALTAALIATTPDGITRLLAAAAFGVGATLGMTLISGVAGLPLSRWSLSRESALASGAVSVVIGAVWLA